MVERSLCMRDVAGSIPVTSNPFFFRCCFLQYPESFALNVAACVNECDEGPTYFLQAAESRIIIIFPVFDCEAMSLFFFFGCAERTCSCDLASEGTATLDSSRGCRSRQNSTLRQAVCNLSCRFPGNGGEATHGWREHRAR